MENSISYFLKNFSKSQTRSIEQIQKEILANKHKPVERQQNLNKTYNVSDIKVVSPFYSRPEHCNNQNCLCPYHRKLRIKEIPLRKIQNRPLYVKTANNSPNKEIRTQIKEDHLHQIQRLTAKPKQSSVKNNIVYWQTQRKVDSHNHEYDQFLSQFEQILFKKAKLNVVDLHRIKKSVGEIFKYIYTHLHEEKQIVEQHISKIEKDRDFTNFYLQRFIQLKQRITRIKQEKNAKSTKQKTLITKQRNEVDSASRKNSKAKTKFYQRRDFIKKTVKSRYQKLLVERFLEDIECGQEIEDDELQGFANLEIQRFQENCQFLQKKISEMDEEMLQQLLNQIVHKTKNKVAKKEQSTDKITKITALDKLIELINSKMEDIRKNGDQEQIAYGIGASSHSIKTRGNSIHSINRNKNVTILGKNNQSLFTKSGFNQIQRWNNDSELSKDDILDDLQEKVDENQISGRRQSPKAMTIFVEGQQENIKMKTGKSGKLQLAKYRRLSHDVFYHKKILGEQDQQLIYQKIKIMTLKDISGQLENLAFQFAKKKHKLRDIEGKIKDFSLHKYIIHQNDSLITAKRKIRVIKSLMKDEEFDHHLKGEMKEYLALIEEQNYLKNRRWANKKIRNVLQMGLQDEEVELCQVEGDETDKYYFQRLVSEIFSKNSKLIFYQIYKTNFQEKEINFEQHVTEFMNSTLILQKKQRQLKSERKKAQANKNKAVFQQEEKFSDLMQIGLNNKCISNSNYLKNQQWQSQQLYKTGQLLQEEQPIQLSEDRYLSLFNELASLSKQPNI